MQRHQYCCQRTRGYPKPTKSPFLNNQQCTRYKWICSGIKACQYMLPHVAQKPHLLVTLEHWEQQALTRHYLDRSEPDTILRQTKAQIDAIVNLFQNQKACYNQLATCRPIWTWSSPVSTSCRSSTGTSTRTSCRADLFRTSITHSMAGFAVSTILKTYSMRIL